MNANEKSKTTIGNIGQYSNQSKNALKYAYSSNEKVDYYDRHENQATATMTSARV